MFATNSRWQRVLGVMVTLIMVLALVTPSAVDAHQAPARQTPDAMQGQRYSARFVGQTNGSAAQIAERLYGPSRSIAESATGRGTGPYKEQVGTFRLPWAKPSNRPSNGSALRGPQTAADAAGPVSEQAGPISDSDKKIYDEEPSPDLWAFWEGLNMGVNRSLFGFGFLPPDTTGDTSGDVYSYGYYVQTVNTTMAVWDYSQTNIYGGWPKTVLGPMPMNVLWAGTGTSCEYTNDGDPIVRYDEQADRWLISQFALPAFDGLYPSPFAYPFAECIAISMTGDPTGGYYLYEFVAPTTGIDDDGIQSTPQVAGAKMPDYPKFGVWQDGYYMTVNQFDEINFEWGGAGLYAFERSAMLTGAAADMFYFDPFSDFNCSMETLYSTETNPFCFLGGMLPADNDGGWANWGGGNSAYFAMFDEDTWSTPSYTTSDALEIWAMDVTWGVGASFGLDSILPVAPFDSNLCNYSRDCIRQPGTTVGLDAIPDRLMDRLQYRLIDRSGAYGPTYEAMVTNHSVDVNGADRAGVRWYELRRDWTGSWGPWYVYQQGTYSPDTDSRWMGSIAMDSVGNLGLGYTVSSSTTYPAIRYTTHAVGDPLGLMRDEVAITSAASAAGSQTSSSHRWGDYSAMTVAAGSGCDFVYTNEYLRGTTPAEWYTRMGNFGFMSCFYGDVEGPILYWLSTPPDPDAYRDGSFDWDVYYEANLVDRYECSLDGSAWATCTPPYAYTGLSTGWHTFEVRGVDDLGNIGEPISYTWEITAATATFTSLAARDGYLIESTEFSGIGGIGGSAAGYYVQVGDYTSDRQVKGLVAFNVSLPGGAVITSVELRYRFASAVGTNPFGTHGAMLVDLANPYFGATGGLAPSDFEASPTYLDAAGCSSTPTAGWYSCNLYPASWGFLNTSGENQLRLYFTLDDNDDGSSDMLRFFSGNYTNAAYRPVLVINYYIP